MRRVRLVKRQHSRITVFVGYLNGIKDIRHDREFKSEKQQQTALHLDSGTTVTVTLCSNTQKMSATKSSQCYRPGVAIQHVLLLLTSSVMLQILTNLDLVVSYHVPIRTATITTTRILKSRSRRTSTTFNTMTSLFAQVPNEERRFSGSEGTGIGWIDPSAPVNSKASLQKTIQKSLEGSNFQKRISLLGSTGSIGTQTLEIVDVCPNNFVIDALSAGTNVELMVQQVMKYTPKLVSMSTVEAANDLKERLIRAQCPNMPDIVFGDEGIIAAATIASADTVVTGIVGAAGLQPTIEAIKAGKDIALANKETLISGGPVINPLVEQYGVNMVRFVFLFLRRVYFQRKEISSN
jgi:1-deoxy-D-xylulose 5-phosphate reductoisomerase